MEMRLKMFHSGIMGEVLDTIKDKMPYENMSDETADLEFVAATTEAAE